MTGGNRNIANKDGEAMVASACTLVAGRMFGGTVPSSSSYVDVAAISAAAATMMTLDATVGLLLLGVILLDSVNMKTDPGKGTTRDDSAIRALLQCTNLVRIRTRERRTTTAVAIVPRGCIDLDEHISPWTGVCTG